MNAGMEQKVPYFSYRGRNINDSVQLVLVNHVSDTGDGRNQVLLVSQSRSNCAGIQGAGR